MSDGPQNRDRFRFIRAQRSELFRVTARRLAYEMVSKEYNIIKLKITALVFDKHRTKKSIYFKC